MKVIISWSFKNVVFSKAIFFLLGPLFTHRLVEYAVFCILVTHLTEGWGLPLTAAIVNLQEGSYLFLQIFFAYIADAYSGLFSMVLGSTALYIILLGLVLLGLVLSIITSSEGEFPDQRTFYAALVLVTFSQAAERVTLKRFLRDQVVSRTTTQDDDDDHERALSRSKFWWYSTSLLAAVVALSATLLFHTFRSLLLGSAIAMAAGFLWFLSGVKFYKLVKPSNNRPLNDAVLVIYTAIARRNVEYPKSPEQLLGNSSGLVEISPQVSWLRWLDKAAVVEQDQEKPGHRICSVEQVQGVKFLLKMLPMWTSFLTFSLVAATGTTFFLEEAHNIYKEFPLLLFIFFQRFTDSVVAQISDYVLEKLCKKNNNNNNAQRLILVRIGVGMICCVLCCIAAWLNSLRWSRLVRENKDPGRRMINILRLIPQYFLLGAMQGLSQGGLENLFDSQGSEAMSRYGLHFGECVMGVGKLLSVVYFTGLDRHIQWLNDDICSSHLDKYNAALAALSAANLVFYCLVAHWYGRS